MTNFKEKILNLYCRAETVISERVILFKSIRRFICRLVIWLHKIECVHWRKGKIS